uniref:Exopolysaccharide biosynthesis protein n=1 Tax=Arsenophonus nasoniae TaxID=638 RepID=D2TYN2_9GAMM|nr:exopolysaccharide biosynthesis protein [Arsenophonus nasoniae]
MHKTNKILSKLKVIDKIDFILLNKKKIAIVSNNCWNIRIYKNLKQPYNTPFVGLFISTPDFINMLPNLQNFLHLELKQSHFIKNDNYPIAILDGVKINFLHYKNSSSSIEKWNKRRLRLINFINENGLDSVIFKCCDSDSFDNNDQYKFDKLKFKRKIYFKNIKNSMIMNLDGTFPDGIQLYKIRIAYYFKFIKLFRGL